MIEAIHPSSCPNTARMADDNDDAAVPLEDAAAVPTGGFESLDLDGFDSAKCTSNETPRTSHDRLLHTAARWTLAALIGVLTALIAFVVNLAVENVAGFKFYMTSVVMKQSMFTAWSFYSLANAALVGTASALAVYVAPAAAGSGIPEVKGYLNGVKVSGILDMKTLGAKVVGSTAVVAGGLVVGKEGPFVHMGACIGSLLARAAAGAGGRGWRAALRSDSQVADMVTCGACAGVAAAFRAPVGAVLFAMEETASWWSNELMWLAFFTTAVVSVVTRFLMASCAGGGCGFFGEAEFIYFRVRKGQQEYHPYELAPMLLLGLAGGLLGSLFNAANAHLCRLRRQLLQRQRPLAKVLEAAAVAAVTATISIGLPLLFPCQPCPPADADADADAPCPNKLHGGDHVQFACSAGGQYNDMASLFFVPQDDAIRNLFSAETKQEFAVATLLCYFFIFFALCIVTYGCTFPAGLFVPCILCGAAYGRLMGVFVADYHPQHRVDEGTYALLGAASFMGGSMRVSVALTVMMLEVTSNLDLLPLIMLVMLVSKAVGDATGIKAVYELNMELKGIPFLDNQPDSFFRHISSREASSRSVVSLPRLVQVRALLQVLRSCDHNGFPVFAAAGRPEQELLGVVLRQHLLVLLQRRDCHLPASAQNRLQQADGYVPPPVISTTELSAAAASAAIAPVDAAALDDYLDLEPYAAATCVVEEQASMAAAHRLLRGLGLRHLCVIPRPQRVLGLLTRKDLLPDEMEERLLHAPAASPRAGSGEQQRPLLKQRLRSELQLGPPPTASSGFSLSAGLGSLSTSERRRSRCGPSEDVEDAGRPGR